jgi:hypothetical protein
MVDTVLNQYEADKLPPQERTNRIGIVDTRGGIITVDVQVSEFFKKLHVGVGGDIIILGKNGNYIPYLGLNNGATIAVEGNMVVSTATIDGVVVTTSCDDITWHGGI